MALVLPWTSGRDVQQCAIARVLVAIGLVLGAVAAVANRRLGVGARGDPTDVR